MSHPLLNPNPDLKRLRDEGYNLEVSSNYLLIHDVPYVNSAKEVKRGILASELTLAGDRTVVPSTHVALFAGEYPCHKDGTEIAQIRNQTVNQKLREGVVATFQFSNKPEGGYRDYYHKMTTYIAIISGPAEALQPSVTAREFRPVPSHDEECAFNYVDTASSRAGINAVSEKLKGQRIAIVGLGGTGSYVLDLVVKTWVEEIHVFDGDYFLQHNAFRAPGAPSLAELQELPKKAIYFSQLYSKMRKNIIAHPYRVDSSNVHLLDSFNFVFICVDKADARRLIVTRLVERGIPFVDVGMGVTLVEGLNEVVAVLRVTSVTPQKRDHLERRMPFGDGADDDYTRNIQIADLNALNAALAVVKWKKMSGVYQDREREHHSTYSLNGHLLTSDELPDVA